MNHLVIYMVSYLSSVACGEVSRPGGRGKSSSVDAGLGRQIRLSTKLSITELSENRPGTQIPTGPSEWRISVHVFDINPRTGIQKHLDGCFRAEGRRAVQRRFSLGSAIAHEVIRWNRWLGHAIGIRTIGEEHYDHYVMSLSIGGAEGCVQW